MKFYGITGVANRLMESCLWNRYQRVVINEYSSTWKEVQHGVPQGSVLGPFLFLIYINDLSKSISDKSIQILFAEDTSFIITNHDDNELNEVFNKINK
jgi:predicted 3-demethylubiquinone-9 3-methyltransferase (glyoxalase superfamily)